MAEKTRTQSGSGGSSSPAGERSDGGTSGRRRKRGKRTREERRKRQLVDLAMDVGEAVVKVVLNHPATRKIKAAKVVRRATGTPEPPKRKGGGDES